jgi:hypothetical protein
MLTSLLKLIYCLTYFPCAIMLLIFFQWFYYIFNVQLFLIPIYFVCFILLWWYSCTSFSLLPFINHFFLLSFLLLQFCVPHHTIYFLTLLCFHPLLLAVVLSNFRHLVFPVRREHLHCCQELVTSPTLILHITDPVWPNSNRVISVLHSGVL